MLLIISILQKPHSDKENPTKGLCVMLIYNKFLKPQSPNLPVKLYGSGSDGNSLLIEPIRSLFDMGLPKGAYQDDLKQVDYIFLTHEHGDHFNLATLRHVVSVYPQITILTPPALATHIQEIGAYETLKPKLKVLKPLTPTTLLTREKTPLIATLYRTKHGQLQNAAYDVQIPSFYTRLLYATDLESTEADLESQTDGLPKELFNLIFLEANYNEEILNDVIQKADQALRKKVELDEEKHLKNQLFRAYANYRHLSERQAEGYIAKYLTNEGLFIPMHPSKQFGTYIQKGLTL